MGGRDRNRRSLIGGKKKPLYSEKDNRHFVYELKKTRDESISKESESNQQPYKDVFVSFRVLNIHAIDQVNQRFHILFNTYVAWDEDLTNIPTIKDDQVKKGKWRKEMFYPKDEISKVFDPQVRFTNCMDWNKDEHEEWFRVVSYTTQTEKDKLNVWDPYKYLSVKQVSELQKQMDTNKNMTNTHSGKYRIIWAQRVQGWFEEDFEMGKFPLDIQHLHIGITSRWDSTKVGLSFDKFNPSTVSSQALTSQTWELCDPRILSFRDDWDVHTKPLLTDKLDSATGKKISDNILFYRV